MPFTSHLKKRILVQDQGGREFQTGGIQLYFEDLKFTPNADIGPKDFFEMACNLKGRSFLKLIDFSTKEIEFLLELAMDLKRAKYSGTEQPRLKGKNIFLIFEKSSTRTRCAFETAAYGQGAP